MNVLSYRTSDINGLSFDLLIDGESVHEIFASDTVGVPYWLLEGGLTPMTIMDQQYHIVSVCDCGEAGCGVIACKVSEDGDEVTFNDFKFMESDLSFKFSAENYHQILDEIGHEVLKFTGPQTEVATEQHNFDVMKAYLNAVEDLLRKPSTRDQIAVDCGIENYGAQEAANWICEEHNLDAVRKLIVIEKHKLLMLDQGLVAPVILQHEYRPWTLKVIVGDDKVTLVVVGLLHNTEQTVGTKSLKFSRAQPL